VFISRFSKSSYIRLQNFLEKSSKGIYKTDSLVYNIDRNLAFFSSLISWFAAGQWIFDNTVLYFAIQDCLAKGRSYITSAFFMCPFPQLFQNFDIAT
jgi:hypothetical protein